MRCRVVRAVLLSVVMAAVTGCVVGPNYVRPSVVTPEAYKEIDGWKVAQPQDDALRGAWWETFNDPPLAALEARVSVSNQTLAAAEATYRQATALVREARSAYFPTVTIGAGYTRTRQSSTVTASSGTGAGAVTTSRGAGSSGGPTNFFQLPIDVAWAPDFWG